MEASIGIGLIISLVGCFLGLAGWLTTREKRVWNDGKWQGSVDAKLDGILGIKCEVEALGKAVHEHGSRLTAVETEVSNVHYRITELRGKEGK